MKFEKPITQSSQVFSFRNLTRISFGLYKKAIKVNLLAKLKRISAKKVGMPLNQKERAELIKELSTTILNLSYEIKQLEKQAEEARDFWEGLIDEPEFYLLKVINSSPNPVALASIVLRYLALDKVIDQSFLEAHEISLDSLNHWAAEKEVRDLNQSLNNTISHNEADLEFELDKASRYFDNQILLITLSEGLSLTLLEYRNLKINLAEFALKKGIPDLFLAYHFYKKDEPNFLNYLLSEREVGL